MIKYGSNNIGKMYFGGNQIGKAYLGSNLVFGGGSPTPTTIPYIRCGVGTYINTGINPTNNTRVVIWARNLNPFSGLLFGSYASNSSRFMINCPGGRAAGMFQISFGTSSVTIGTPSKLSHYHKYELNKNSFYVDDVLVCTATNNTFTCNYALPIHGYNNNGTITASSLPMDICKAQIYSNGTLVRDFTPVSSPSVGLYDSVSDTVFTNAGTGTLVYGTFDPDAYTPLEYVSCTGEQYIDTGVYGTKDLKVSVQFKPTSLNVTYPCVFGTMTSSTNGTYFVLQLAYNSSPLSQLNCYIDTTTNNQLYNNTSSRLTYRTLAFSKDASTVYLAENATLLKSLSFSAGSSFVTPETIILAGNKVGGSPAGTANRFYGDIYFANFGPTRNFVPAKVNNVAGFYDTYNDVFYPSESGTAFIAGPQLARTYFFRNRKIAIIGDSISTYNEDGYKYDSYSMYYPNHDVTSVNQTWWKMLIDDDNATLGVNLSYSGSRAATNGSMPTLYDRIGLIGDADTVIIALGTNDSSGSVSLGNYDYTTATASLSTSTFRTAYIKGIRGLLEANPNITIVCAILYMKPDYRASIIEIAKHYGLKYVDCGNEYDLTNQVHPTALGMHQIEEHFLTA